MLRKFSTLAFLITLGFTYTVSAKSWRVNNNVGVNANFTSVYDAVMSASVQPGDTLYLEPSATAYGTNSIYINKRLVVIGPGYFNDPTDVNRPVNAGLQLPSKQASIAFFRLGMPASGSKYLGVNLESSVYLNGVTNVKFEKVYFGYGGIYLDSETNDSISVRKCFFLSGSGITTGPNSTNTNLVVENNLFYGGYSSMNNLSGTGNIFRNNSIYNAGYIWTITNMYVANNIFGVSGESSFVNCTIKNNLFQANQTLPVTASNNQVSVNMDNVYVGGTTGSLDSRLVLKAGSPAIGAGLTVGAVVSPDCGAFGATDPYKLSGIPNIPTIYSLTVPVSIASGASTMNVTFSTRNNQ